VTFYRQSIDILSACEMNVVYGGRKSIFLMKNAVEKPTKQCFVPFAKKWK